MKTLNAIIQLRRDNDYNFERIKNTFIPAKGEMVLVDTSRDGLRIKIGDGVSTFNQLDFIDSNFRDLIIIGYYDDGVFYKNSLKQEAWPSETGRIYIDNSRSKIYFYNGHDFVLINEFPSQATANIPGIMKLYNALGNNTDGTMTQKSITEEFNTRYKTSVNANEELLVFSL